MAGRSLLFLDSSKTWVSALGQAVHTLLLPRNRALLCLLISAEGSRDAIRYALTLQAYLGFPVVHRDYVLKGGAHAALVLLQCPLSILGLPGKEGLSSPAVLASSQRTEVGREVPDPVLYKACSLKPLRAPKGPNPGGSDHNSLGLWVLKNPVSGCQELCS